MTNEHCKFYDPNNGTLVTMTGEIFLVDLLEKLEGKVDLIQSNTDGVIAKPLPGVKDEELVAIINEWQERTLLDMNVKDDIAYLANQLNHDIPFENKKEVLEESIIAYNSISKAKFIFETKKY